MIVQWLRQRSTLQWALGASVLVHAALLTVRAVDPVGFNRLFENTPLDVILVNSRSDQVPEVAQAIAQASLAGGGSADTGLASSPLPSTQDAQIGNAPEPQRQSIASLKQRQQALLTQVREQLAHLSSVDPKASANTPQAAEQERKRQALLNMLAQIEKRVAAENARPRKHYISPATREAIYAVYYDALRQQIEDQGTRRFPEENGQKLYGELTMVITINQNGQVLDTEVADPSRSPALDRRAQALVRAQRFSPFTAAMRAQADHIVVVSRFRFTRQATLETQLRGQ